MFDARLVGFTLICKAATGFKIEGYQKQMDLEKTGG